MFIGGRCVALEAPGTKNEVRPDVQMLSYLGRIYTLRRDGVYVCVCGDNML